MKCALGDVRNIFEVGFTLDSLGEVLRGISVGDKHDLSCLCVVFQPKRCLGSDIQTCLESLLH